MHKVSIVLLALALVASLSLLYVYLERSRSSQIPESVIQAYQTWKVKNKRLYTSQKEDDTKLQVFYGNYKKVIEHQRNESRTWDMGFTEFMDLTAEEFKEKYLNLKVNLTQDNVVELPTVGLQDGVNWVTQGAVTPVKNQGQCGSCYTFSATGALEGLAFISGRGLQSFSEQELLDCTGNFGNNGCHGGWPRNNFKFVMSYGIMNENQYPYQGYQYQCRYSQGNYRISNYADVPAGNLQQLAAAVSRQPVSIAVDASNWQLYTGGVLTQCGTNLDHAVLLVGYTSQYWIVKNSWGPGWGSQGYIYLGGGNTCGLANAASYPIA